MFATITVILGILAGLVNFGIGIVRRNVFVVAAIRFLAGIVAFGVAIGVIIVKTQRLPLPAALSQINLIYLFIALALFVGATLMLPATIERSLTPPTASPPPRTTGKLPGNDAGVRIANQNEEWVN